MSKVQELTLQKIQIDGGTQPRAMIDQDVVADYAERMKDGDVFPNIVVFHDGTRYWLADGFHRFFAARRNESRSIKCDVHTGDVRDAVLYSVGANSDHGLRRTNADKRRAVEILLNDAEWVKWNNVKIAALCGVSDELVRQRRAIIQPLEDRPERTVERNGKTYQMNTANIGGNGKKTETEVIDTSTGEVVEDAEIRTTTAERIKHIETHAVSDAMQYAAMAISQLERIHADDPRRTEALNKVSKWIIQQGA